MNNFIHYTKAKLGFYSGSQWCQKWERQIATGPESSPSRCGKEALELLLTFIWTSFLISAFGSRLLYI